MGHRKLDRGQRTGEKGQGQRTGTADSDNRQRIGDKGQGTTDITIGTKGRKRRTLDICYGQ